MTAPRLELHAILVGLVGEGGTVYFQPPSNVQMTYPCIVYARDAGLTKFADNAPYTYNQRYQVTVIDRDPDSDIPRKVTGLPKTSYNRGFVADNLHHDVLELYY